DRGGLNAVSGPGQHTHHPNGLAIQNLIPLERGHVAPFTFGTPPSGESPRTCASSQRHAAPCQVRSSIVSCCPPRRICNHGGRPRIFPRRQIPSVTTIYTSPCTSVMSSATAVCPVSMTTGSGSRSSYG